MALKQGMAFGALTFTLLLRSYLVLCRESRGNSMFDHENKNDVLKEESDDNLFFPFQTSFSEEDTKKLIDSLAKFDDSNFSELFVNVVSQYAVRTFCLRG